MNVPAPLLTIKETAALLSVSVSTVKRLVKERQIKVVHIGRALRFDILEVQSYIVRHSTRRSPLELKGHIASFQREHTAGGID